MMNSIRRRGSPAVAWIAVLVSAIAASGTAHGHGFPLSLHYDSVTNRLAVRPYSSSPLTGGFFNADGLTVYRNFDMDESFSGLNDLYFTDFPGFIRTSSIPANTTIGLRFVAPLRYWNTTTQAEDPLPVSNASMEIMNALDPGSSAFVDRIGVTGINPITLGTFVGQTNGDHKHFTGYFLSPQVDPFIAADTFGMYGLWATASATGSGFAGGASLESDPFLIMLNYGIGDATTYNTGVERLAATVPVPEPSTLAILGAATATGLFLRCRRLRLRRTVR